MSDRPASEISGLLARWGESAKARDDAVRILYSELRRVAGGVYASSGPGHETLQPTALINEAMLKLLGGANAAFDDRRHFFGAAARAMRQVLVDRARHRLASKRGDGVRPLPLDSALDVALPAADELIALDDALTRLEALDAQAARVVELRYFAGLTLEETAAVLDVSTATVKRDWAMARAWLYRELTGGDPSKETSAR